MTPHLHTLRVYYEDTDFSGAVYHASYLRFMERARTEFLRTRGVEKGAAFVSGGADKFGFVVRSMQIDWLKPARMDDLLTVETHLEKLGGATLDLGQRVLRGEELLVSAQVRVACAIDGRAARLPADLRAKLV